MSQLKFDIILLIRPYYFGPLVTVLAGFHCSTLRLATKPLKWKTGVTYDTPRIRRVSYGYHTNTRIILYIYALRLRILCSRNNEIPVPLLFRYDAVEVENDLMCVSYEHAHHKDVSNKYLLYLFFSLIEHFGAF